MRASGRPGAGDPLGARLSPNRAAVGSSLRSQMNASGVERSVPFEFLDTTGSTASLEKNPSTRSYEARELHDFDLLDERTEEVRRPDLYGAPIQKERKYFFAGLVDVELV